MKIEMAKACKLDFMFVGKCKFISNLISFFQANFNDVGT